MYPSSAGTDSIQVGHEWADHDWTMITITDTLRSNKLSHEKRFWVHPTAFGAIWHKSVERNLSIPNTFT